MSGWAAAISIAAYDLRNDYSALSACKCMADLLLTRQPLDPSLLGVMA